VNKTDYSSFSIVESDRIIPADLKIAAGTGLSVETPNAFKCRI